uniref:Uncharacterized protein n=1 Tax=Guillardia theta TaxID=55529 RepID=A0A7S4PIK1_GUITH|mmetsp:Transcript_51912/g.161501  ORF Transcript_51912/g.161501 Transcript_51912/m.161501 type:complete len:469 (+) Transcript_51912:26-1432(+)
MAQVEEKNSVRVHGGGDVDEEGARARWSQSGQTRSWSRECGPYRGEWADRGSGLMDEMRCWSSGRTRSSCLGGAGCFSNVMEPATCRKGGVSIDLPTTGEFKFLQSVSGRQKICSKRKQRRALTTFLLQCLAVSEITVAMTLDGGGERAVVPRAGTVYDGLDSRAEEINQETGGANSNPSPSPLNPPREPAQQRTFSFSGPFMLTLGGSGNSGMLRGSFTNLPSTMRSSTETDDQETSLSDEGLDSCIHHRMEGRNVLDGAGSLDYPISRQAAPSRHRFVQPRSEADNMNTFSRSSWSLPENFDVVYQNHSSFNLSSIPGLAELNPLEEIPIDPGNFQAEVNLLMVSNGTATTSPIGTLNSFPALMFLFHRLSRIRLPAIFVRSRTGQASSGGGYPDGADFLWDDDGLGTVNNADGNRPTYAEAAAGKPGRQAQTKQPYFFRGRASEPMLMSLKSECYRSTCDKDKGY